MNIYIYVYVYAVKVYIANLLIGTPCSLGVSWVELDYSSFPP